VAGKKIKIKMVEKEYHIEMTPGQPLKKVLCKNFLRLVVSMAPMRFDGEPDHEKTLNA
jgi:hypothetical protein